MTADATLFDLAPLVTPDHEPTATIQEQFDAWSAANPWVLQVLERLVDDWLNAGHKRVGIKQCWEVLRWQYGSRAA